MDAITRRTAISALLEQSISPVSATALAQRFSVSRQVIVGDVALLRAGGVAISATPKGYFVRREVEGVLHTIACHHSAEALERELTLMVDNGCTVTDVTVEHPVYGLLTGQLSLSSRYDVSEFLRRVSKERAAPLSILTGGVHLHTLRCPDEDAFLRVYTALGEAGFLVEG